MGLKTCNGTTSNFQWVGEDAEFWYDIAIGDRYSRDGHKQIKATGYSINEIIKIECAFEGSKKTPDGSFDYDGFNGLMSVVDTLMETHEATKEEAQQAKELFVLTDAG